MTVNNHDEELLAELLLQWEELYERGQDSSPQELCRDCPHLVDELAKRIAAMRATNWLNDPDCPAAAEAPRTNQSIGKVLGGRYRLDDLIATGGFAEVWRAFDTELQRIVAIKLPKPNRLASATNFITEARRVARLKHPGIVPVFDVGTEGTNCFIVSEYVEGGSLGDRLTKKRPTIEETTRWLGEIAIALEYAHLHGVIHRDIKPANILIDHHGRALLADFGIAQSAQKTGTFAPSLGTLRYMSPEQLEGKPATPQSDVYSLGVVLHECITGRLPYSSNEPSVLRRQIVDGATQVSKEVPAALWEVCTKATQRLPHERHTSAAHFASELERAAGKTSSQGMWWRSRFALLGLSVLLLVSALTFGVFSLNTRSDTTRQATLRSESRSAPNPQRPPERGGERTPTSLSDGLVLYWTFDEDSSQKVSDQSPAHNDGVTHGASWQADGVNGGYLNFDGYDDYIAAGSHDSLAMKYGELTCAAWVKLRQGGRIICKRNGPWDYICDVTPTHAIFSFFDSSYMPYGDSDRGFSVPVTLDEQWHHLVWVVTTREMSLYLDGNLIGQKPMVFRLPVHDAADVWVGADPNLGRVSPYTYGGLLDNLMLWNRALSPAEVTAIAKPASTPNHQHEAKPLPIRENSIGMKLLRIPAGEFFLGAGFGDSKSAPGVRVRLSAPFFLGQTEVTQAQWRQVMGELPADIEVDDDRPVRRISWQDAKEFCRRLSELSVEKQSGLVYRLPTEAEWEYACKAGRAARHAHGSDDGLLGNYAWLYFTSRGKPHPVAKKQPNPWGLYDMRGNVWEWVSDWSDAIYQAEKDVVIDPQGPTYSPEGKRVVCGGSWGDNADSFRSESPPDSRGEAIGMRVAASCDDATVVGRPSTTKD